jgi:hypothetical protein
MRENPDIDITDELPDGDTDSSDPAGGMHFPKISSWVLRTSMLAGVAITAAAAYNLPPTGTGTLAS